MLLVAAVGSKRPADLNGELGSRFSNLKIPLSRILKPNWQHGRISHAGEWLKP
jgi:hypothetical protein